MRKPYGLTINEEVMKEEEEWFYDNEEKEYYPIRDGKVRR